MQFGDGNTVGAIIFLSMYETRVEICVLGQDNTVLLSFPRVKERTHL